MKKILLVFMAINLFIGCQKNDSNAIRLNQHEKTLHYGDKWQIEAESASKITYASKNEFHAIVSEEGLVTAGFVGNTEIELSNGHSVENVKIIVTPEYNLFPDPIVDFGISRNEVISRMGRTPDASTETMVGYKDYCFSVPELLFSFDENDCLKATGMMISTSFTKECTAHLAERYMLIQMGTNSDPFLFINGTPDTMTMGVSLDVYDASRLFVMYIPLSQSKTSSYILDAYKEIRKAF